MGHERLGFLPKTAKWRTVLLGLSKYADDQIDIKEIGNKTLQNVRTRFEALPEDQGVVAAFKFLLAIGAIAKGDGLPMKLKKSGLNVSLDWSPLNFAKAASDWVDKNKASNEYSELAKRATSDTLIDWFNKNDTGQGLLFKNDSLNADIWRNIGNGGNFSDAARIFLAKFTERYVKYFLEREASSILPNLEIRNRFRNNLELQMYRISEHAFESAQIAQSFTAGWFNKNMKNDFPSERSIKAFLRFAFYKMREELRRQEN